MDNSSNRALQQFKSEVGLRFQLYNSLFTSLPFHRIEKTGILLSLLSNNCDEGYKKHLSPIRIIDEFITRHTTYITEKEKTDLLFRFVQYVERQVVLFDALEDAAYTQVHDLNGIGTLKQLESEVIQENKQRELSAKLKDFCVRLVLTAHPTQFYPGPVLGIINDLSKALADNNTNLINTYLQQLGKTPFFKKQKPTPYDEAISLIWYLENVFYTAGGKILTNLKSQFPDAVDKKNPVTGEMTQRKSYQKDNATMNEVDDAENEDELTDNMDDDQNSKVEADEAAGEEFIDKDPNRIDEKKIVKY